MEDCSLSGKRPPYTIRVTPSKPDAKRERRVDTKSEQITTWHPREKAAFVWIEISVPQKYGRLISK